MEFVTLNNNIKMPLLGLGTYTLQGNECEKCISEAIEIGYTLIDTAQMYANEKYVGNAIKHYDRKNLFITTKSVCALRRQVFIWVEASSAPYPYCFSILALPISLSALRQR